MHATYLITTLTVLLAVLLQTGPIYLPLVRIREPINASGPVSICDEVHLRAALSGGGTVTFSCSGTITLTAEIVVSANTTIDGSGQTVTISGNNAVRVFTVNSGVTLNLNELTIAEGYIGDDIFVTGGGISNSGTLTVSNSTFSGNRASGDFANSGGIDNDGTLTVTNSTFSDNRASGVTSAGCGAIGNSGTLTVSASTFSGNGSIVGSSNPSSASGGGICNSGTLTVINSTFSDNGASDSGGAISNSGTLTISDSIFSGNSTGHGGGIYNGSNGTLIVSNSTFTDNRASIGGGIFNKSSKTATVSDSTFSGNTTSSSGGGSGIFNGDNGEATMLVSNCTFFDNSAIWKGGAIYNGAILTVSNSTFSDNSTAYSGGGIYNAATLTVSNSTFSDNSADNYGGGIYNAAILTVSNSTFSGNRATSSGATGRGGGIRNSGTLTVSNSTFSGNSGTILGGGINNFDGIVTLKNTIVANSIAGGNCSGTITDGGGNLSYPDTTCPGINRDPKLGPLQNNGGPTHTMALGTGSAAIDAGNDAICAAAPVNNLDQRGVTRPRGPHCDIGAVEQR